MPSGIYLTDIILRIFNDRNSGLEFSLYFANVIMLTIFYCSINNNLSLDG